MRIERISVGHVSLPMRRPMRTASLEAATTENAVVEVEAEGLSGSGAALTFRPQQALSVCAMIADLGEQLLGGDAWDVRGHWQRLRRQLTQTGRTGIGMLALAALDTALWDLVGQASQLPLHRLLGSLRDELPVYVQPGWLSYDDDELIEEALAYQEQGYRHYKMRVGSDDWRNDLRRVERVRAALSDDTALLVDANEGWSPLVAAAAVRALDPLKLYWIEEPVAMSEPAACSRLAAATWTPIAGGEGAFAGAEISRLLAARAVDVLMCDLQHCGGPTGFLQVAAEAEWCGLPVSNHLFSEVSLHLLAACPNAAIVEQMPGWWDDLYERPVEIVRGIAHLSAEAGIGVRLAPAVRAQLAPIG